jgi:glucose-1-phosphate cytidylyltransferase
MPVAVALSLVARAHTLTERLKEDNFAMKVVVLCGGLGTRLREETEFRPKPLVEIGGRPVLWHIMKTYAHYGFREFVLCLGYRAGMIKDYFLNYDAMNNDFTICLGRNSGIRYEGSGHGEQNFQVTLAETGLLTMTGGRVQRIQKYVQDDRFMLTYGDGLSDLDIGRLMDFHRGHGKIGTVTAVRPTSRFGTLDFGSDGTRVLTFREKPRAEHWTSAGFFVFEPAIFDYLGGDDCTLEREPLERLAADGQLMAYQHEGFFAAMDTHREYKQLNDMWDSGTAPWASWREGM